MWVVLKSQTLEPCSFLWNIKTSKPSIKILLYTWQWFNNGNPKITRKLGLLKSLLLTRRALWNFAKSKSWRIVKALKIKRPMVRQFSKKDMLRATCKELEILVLIKDFYFEPIFPNIQGLFLSRWDQSSGTKQCL